MISKLVKELEIAAKVSLDSDRYLLFGNAFEKRSIFLYKSGSKKPSYAVRIPLGERGLEQCKREYGMLRALSGLDLPRVDWPRPVDELHLGNHVCFVQKATYADSLMSLLPLSPWSRLDTNRFYWLTDILISIYQSSKSEAMAGKSYGKCFQHGDFWAGNLGRRGNTLVMHDLEFASTTGWPLYDLLHFGLYFRVVMSNIGRVKLRASRGTRTLSDKRIIEADAMTVQKAFLDKSSLARLMRACIRRYAAGCGINREDVFSLSWQYFSQDRKIGSLSYAETSCILDT